MSGFDETNGNDFPIMEGTKKCYNPDTKRWILLDKKVIELLKEAKDNPRQTYNEILTKMAKQIIALKQRNQYDEFLHKIQQPKMEEIWDNYHDEVWENL